MHCHDTNNEPISLVGGDIALVGQPNVGKSALFQRLTGQRVTISNYPGTTVEVTRGKIRDLADVRLVDTPGIITFPSTSEDEQVTERLLLDGTVKAIVQVGDAKNLRRTLMLTAQLIELGLPTILVLNMMDEADAHGVVIDLHKIQESFSIPVIPATAVRGIGIPEITSTLQSLQLPQYHLAYPAEIENLIGDISRHLPESRVSAQALALMWLTEDQVVENWLCTHLDAQIYCELSGLREAFQITRHEPLSATIQKARSELVNRVISTALLDSGSIQYRFSSVLSRLTIHPIWGLPILGLILYGLYLFVGIFGAGVLVNLFENHLFSEILNPWLIEKVNWLIPIQLLRDLLIGQYGIWTMGMTYAVALIFPIVTTFFIAFGVMEDSGYLPRLAVLSNRFFEWLGLNGKAVLPMVLGLGCVTMATMTTRVLDSKRERILTTLLLALAIPCSAQLGIVMGMLAGISFSATLIWSGMVVLVLLVVGWLAARVFPGERTNLLVELPPLRVPLLSNVLTKTLARLEWYIKEVIPLFVVGTVALFILDKTSLLAWLMRLSEPVVVDFLGLPAQASAAFVMGFLRRDFGATGLFVLGSQGLLSPAQTVVAMTTITLLIPCLASLMMIGKERGWKTAISMFVVIIPFAVLVGGAMNYILAWVGWGA